MILEPVKLMVNISWLRIDPSPSFPPRHSLGDGHRHTSALTGPSLTPSHTPSELAGQSLNSTQKLWRRGNQKKQRLEKEKVEFSKQAGVNYWARRTAEPGQTLKEPQHSFLCYRVKLPGDEMELPYLDMVPPPDNFLGLWETRSGGPLQP